jgi:hypothetical protein
VLSFASTYLRYHRQGFQHRVSELIQKPVITETGSRCNITVGNSIPLNSFLAIESGYTAVIGGPTGRFSLVDLTVENGVSGFCSRKL